MWPRREQIGENVSGSTVRKDHSSMRSKISNEEKSAVVDIARVRDGTRNSRRKAQAQFEIQISNFIGKLCQLSVYVGNFRDEMKLVKSCEFLCSLLFLRGDNQVFCKRLIFFSKAEVGSPEPWLLKWYSTT